MNKIQPWQTVKQNSIHKTPWIEIVADDCMAGEVSLTYTYTRRLDQGPVIIPETEDGKLWMVQQYRHPIKKIIWQFPAEGKPEDESWEAAARRGVAEELGLEVGELVRLGSLHPDPGGLDQVAEIFLASQLSDLDDGPMETHDDLVEELHQQAFSLKEIEELINRGEIIDGWTFSCLYLYKRFKGL